MADLKHILTSLKVNRINEFLPILEEQLKDFSDEDVARFLANTLVESGKFSTLKENLNYSSSDRLSVVYPSAFAKPPKGLGYNPSNYVRNPQKLANLVYNSNIFSRKSSLGNTQENDGFSFLGRGLMQTTGRNNYTSLSKISKIDFVNNPELLEKPEYAVKSAVSFYNTNKLSKKKTLKDVRIAVNGSEFGYDEVLKMYNEIKKYM